MFTVYFLMVKSRKWILTSSSNSIVNFILERIVFMNLANLFVSEHCQSEDELKSFNLSVQNFEGINAKGVRQMFCKKCVELVTKNHFFWLSIKILFWIRRCRTLFGEKEEYNSEHYRLPGRRKEEKECCIDEVEEVLNVVVSHEECT